MGTELQHRSKNGIRELELARRSATNPYLCVRGLAYSAALRMRNQVVLLSGMSGRAAIAAFHMPIAALAVFVAGLGMYGSMVAIDQRLASREARRWLEHPLELKEAFRSESYNSGMLEPIVARHEAIRCQVVAADPVFRDTLIDVYLQCTELAFEAARLEERAAGLHRYLTLNSPSDLNVEHERLSAWANGTEDDQANQRFCAAASRKRDQVATRGDIEGIYDRIRARISLIKVTLDSVDAMLVKLCAQDVEEDEGAQIGPDEQVELLTRTVSSLESTLVEVQVVHA